MVAKPLTLQRLTGERPHCADRKLPCLMRRQGVCESGSVGAQKPAQIIEHVLLFQHCTARCYAHLKAWLATLVIMASARELLVSTTLVCRLYSAAVIADASITAAQQCSRHQRPMHVY